MKKIKLLFTLFIFISLSIHAQIPPNALNYSAVARDAASEPITNTTIGIQISILQNSTTGGAVYIENHFVNTDGFGLFNLIIGAGAVQSGAMETIAWDTDNFYLQVGMDAGGGTNFLTMGTTQLMSVPYAMHSATADSLIGGVNTFSGDYNDLSNQPITINSITTNEDSLLLSNGQVYTSSGLIHYVGEVFGGGVVFQVWKDQSGTEHGLIVDLVDLGLSVWSNVDSPFEYIGATAEGLNGMNNSQAIIDQNGHTTSAASLCMGSNNGGFTDWFLPSISELNALQSNYAVIARVLYDIGGQTLTNNTGYWSSNEKMICGDPASTNCSQAIWLSFEQGALWLGAPAVCEIAPSYRKCFSKAVRAIREF